MKITRLTPVVLAAAAMSFACSDSTSLKNVLATDAAITADVAASSGDAIAQSYADMVANENFGGLPGIVASNMTASAAAPLPNYTRSRTCFDVSGAVVANCSPIASVRKVVVHVTLDGARSGSSSTEGGVSKTWSGAIHRVADDTVQRVFNTAQPPAETQRIHSAISSGHDTTTFTEGAVSRFAAEVSHDTVKALTWNLPRSTNPWPVSGKVVRAVNVHVTATRENATESREVTRLVEVIFPADAQGNVVLKINDKTCNLNLVTHAVTSCQ